MNDSNNLLPIASETESEMAALDAQEGSDPVPLRKDAATSGLLPVDRAEERAGEGDEA